MKELTVHSFLQEGYRMPEACWYRRR